MNGGKIHQLVRETDGILLQVRGVGPYRHRFVRVKIEPTNYALREGDLVWWLGGELRWEGRRPVRFQKLPAEGVATAI